MARPLGQDIDSDLQLFEAKLKVLKFAYQQYFMGNRPREPQIERGEVQKIVAYWSNMPIRNTAQRFKFNTLCARFFSFRRKWDETCRQIDAGTYAPHVFKAEMHEQQRRPGAAPDGAAAGGDARSRSEDLYEAFVEARKACGESADGLSREKLGQVLRRQETAIKEKYGCAAVRFRVVVENGKPKLKAQPVDAA
jgi:hypothetical protein